MKEEDHPIAGGLFLLVVAAGLAFAGKSGIEAGQRERLKARIQEAVEIGDRGDDERAEQILLALSKNNPDSAEAQFMLGIVQVSLNKLDEADASFVKALEIEPEDWESVAERATIRKMKGEGEEALKLLESIPPGKGHLYERLGDAVWQDLYADTRFEAILTRHGRARESSTRHGR